MQDSLVLILNHNTTIFKQPVVDAKINILDKIKDNHTELMNLGERDAFYRGFSLAVRLMIDNMSGKN